MITSILFAAIPFAAPPLFLQDEHPTDHPTGDHPKAKVLNLDEQFDALEEEFNVAVNVYWAGVSAGREAGLSEAEMPTYPNEAFELRFAEIADKGHFDAQTWMSEHTTERVKWFDRILTDHADSQDLEDTFGFMAYYYSAGRTELAEATELFEVLNRFDKRTKTNSFRLASRAVHGLVLMHLETEEQRAQGMAMLKALSSVSVEFPLQAKAASAIFVAENLQIGMTPPSFEAVDVDGNPISLAEYRGKVTVLDFWGFW